MWHSEAGWNDYDEVTACQAKYEEHFIKRHIDMQQEEQLKYLQAEVLAEEAEKNPSVEVSQEIKVTIGTHTHNLDRSDAEKLYNELYKIFGSLTPLPIYNPIVPNQIQPNFPPGTITCNTQLNEEN